MKTKTKNILAVAAIIAVSYTVGKCNGICKLGKTMDKVLKKNYGMHIDKICYDLMRGKIAVDIAFDEEETEENEK